METPIRVLHVLGSVNLGGAESRIMDLYRNIDREKIQFDFMVHTQEKGYFQEEIETMGGRIFCVPRFLGYNLPVYQKAWKQFFKRHKEFCAVHGHMTSTAAIYLWLAKKAGIPVTVAHARSAGTDPGIKGMATRLLRKNLANCAMICLACSKEAGTSVFGKKAMRQGRVSILPNAIETDKYAWNENKREEMRTNLSLQNKWVIGHVGRFHYAKNHEFLLEIFAQIRKEKENAVLLLLGEGSLMETIKEKAKQMHISDAVLFLGNQENVADYYQAMDMVIFPSRFEGMPGTIVEAQATGLPVLVSDSVTKEVKATDLVTFFSLHKTASEWAKEADSCFSDVRTDRREELVKKGFDVKTQIEILQKIYTSGKQ